MNTQKPIVSPIFPGFCITMFDGSVWLTKEGNVTPNYDERGIWMTLPEAEAALEAVSLRNEKAQVPHSVARE